MTGLEMKYFVLKPSGTSPFAIASRAAMRQFALSIQDTNAQLAKDVLSWVNEEQLKAFEGFKKC